MKRVTILTNGPGELWCWVRPVVPLLKEAGCHVTVRLLPCQFASGEEYRVASMLGADDVVPAGKVPGTLRNIRGSGGDLVLQMGGDLVFGLRAAGRRVPLFCYSYGRKAFMGHAERFMTAWPGMVPDATDFVGDLVADAMEMDAGPTPWVKKDAFRLALFPGSRANIREASLEFMKEFRALLDAAGLSVETLTVMSPFAAEREFDRWEQAGMNPARTGAGVVLKEADLALTQPGTNTLELLHAGVPAVVTVPFSFIRKIPLSGIMGALEEGFPGGGWLKEKILRRLSRRCGFVAWPNRISGRGIMPELIGDITPGDLAAAAESLLRDPGARSRQREDLLQLSRGAGAAREIVSLISQKLGLG